MKLGRIVEKLLLGVVIEELERLLKKLKKKIDHGQQTTDNSEQSKRHEKTG